MKTFEQYMTERAKESATLRWFKELLPKSIRKKINQTAHKERYKLALKYYNELKAELEKDGKEVWLKKRGFAKSKGVIVGNIDNYLNKMAADMAGLNYREWMKVRGK